MDNYKEFAARCNQELIAIQKKLYQHYDIDKYANWYYDQATGLFTFSSGGDEINFSYFEVGTYSSKDGTWMWAWHNESVLDKARKNSLLIKNYGEDNGYEALVSGLVECDEYDAWEFVAIAQKIFGGVGVYRPIYKDGLQKFVVLQNIVDNEKAQALKDKYIRCNSHGSARVAFVCRHLTSDTINLGFDEAFETYREMELDEDDDLQAWCNECESVRAEGEGWNDETMEFADIKLVCEDCYFILKNLHTT